MITYYLCHSSAIDLIDTDAIKWYYAYSPETVSKHVCYVMADLFDYKKHIIIKHIDNEVLTRIILSKHYIETITELNMTPTMIHYVLHHLN